MKKVIIIGAGFSGLSAANRLCRAGLGLEVTLIDKKETSDFLPMLPDCLGRGINPKFLSCKAATVAGYFKCKFIREEVTAINLARKEVVTAPGNLYYDYLVIACGSETNFYGNENIRNNAYKLDSAQDARVLLDALGHKDFDSYIISGGGYTGIEVAANLRIFLNKAKKDNPIMIVERASEILGPLPEWMKKHVVINLKKLNIDVFTNSAIEKIEDSRVYLSQGRAFERALVIWAAGVKTAKCIQDLSIEKNPQGRVKVDEFLKLNESCFVAGDAANFSNPGGPLRMAVQFAIFEGGCAALNIINSIKGKALREYHPVDLGYIIPMANNRSCGRVLGINLKGLVPTMFHFVMCIYRSYGLRNKIGIIRGLLKGCR